ncbi:Lrp/AsnC family transcriptional regulator [Hwanghaeella grinnelliae]|nr:Lrp/AsnC family transcriptional regulator [Hwanghaeella grinnelliae]
MLDARDRRILSLLQKDARTTAAEMADAVGLSLSACAKRMARLWSDGYIDRMVAVLDRKRFRRPVSAAVMVTLTQPKASYTQEFTRRIQSLEEVQQCHIVTGDFDFLLIVQAKTIEAYHDMAQNVFGESPYVRSYKTVFLLGSLKNENTLPDFCLIPPEE